MSRISILGLARSVIRWVVLLWFVVISMLWITSYDQGFCVSRVYPFHSFSILNLSGRVLVQVHRFTAQAPPADWACYRLPSSMADRMIDFNSRWLGFAILHYQSRSYAGRMLMIPLWAVWGISALAARSALRGEFRARAARKFLEQGRCPGCGYDLRGTPERCPECGCVVYRPLPQFAECGAD
jgi:hypothetical protein